MIAKCDYPDCNANAALFSPYCYRHREPVRSEGERECDECGCTFMPATTDEDDTWCESCADRDNADREYQFMEATR